jgi:1-acyl-sn-glycerol-3-phosphate acyltransferase
MNQAVTAFRSLFFGANFLLEAARAYPELKRCEEFSEQDPTRRAAGRALRKFGRRVVMNQPGWLPEIVGKFPEDIAERPYVVVANHRSLADPFLLSLLPWDMRWVVKRELLDWPLAGTLLRLGGDIPVDRDSKLDGRRALREAERALRAGQRLMLFPEGRRSRGQVLPFKAGALYSAVRVGAPVLPIAISGTENWIRGQAIIGGGLAKAQVLAPIETEGRRLGEVELLAEEVRVRIAKALTESAGVDGLSRATGDALQQVAPALPGGE